MCSSLTLLPKKTLEQSIVSTKNKIAQYTEFEIVGSIHELFTTELSFSCAYTYYVVKIRAEKSKILGKANCSLAKWVVVFT